MKWVAIVAAGIILGLLVAAHFVIPGIAENDVSDRLTEGGGNADVSISAFPGERLLFGSGDHISVNADDLDLDLTSDQDVLSRLDDFDQVDVAINSSQVGPFAIEDFALTRDGDGPYGLSSSLTTSGADLLEFGASAVGIVGSSVIGAFAQQFDPVATPIPIELDMQLESDDGRVQVVSGGGTIAGYPTGPLAELLTAAIVVRL